jgi:hypothetical protein
MGRDGGRVEGGREGREGKGRGMYASIHQWGSEALLCTVGCYRLQLRAVTRIFCALGKACVPRQRRIKVVGGVGPTELDEQKKGCHIVYLCLFVILLY